jgi:hypothetical protein
MAEEQNQLHSWLESEQAGNAFYVVNKYITWPLSKRKPCRLTCLVLSFGVRLSGPCFVSAIYYLLYRHSYVFLTIICKVMRKRLGPTFGMVWTAIGVIITFNVVFNHLMAMLIKPGGPKDLAVS